MDEVELNILIEQLETRRDLTVADFEGVVQALHFLLPDHVAAGANLAQRLNVTDDAMQIADHAFPNWAIHIKGRTNDADGHWTCTLRESDKHDRDTFIGLGKSPVLSQSILAAVIRLAMLQPQTD